MSFPVDDSLNEEPKIEIFPIHKQNYTKKLKITIKPKKKKKKKEQSHAI